jgi:hypothetical protein
LFGRHAQFAAIFGIAWSSYRDVRDASRETASIDPGFWKEGRRAGEKPALQFGEEAMTQTQRGTERRLRPHG